MKVFNICFYLLILKLYMCQKNENLINNSDSTTYINPQKHNLRNGYADNNPLIQVLNESIRNGNLQTLHNPNKLEKSQGPSNLDENFKFQDFVEFTQGQDDTLDSEDPSEDLVIKRDGELTIQTVRTTHVSDSRDSKAEEQKLGESSVEGKEKSQDLTISSMLESLGLDSSESLVSKGIESIAGVANTLVSLIPKVPETVDETQTLNRSDCVTNSVSLDSGGPVSEETVASSLSLDNKTVTEGTNAQGNMPGVTNSGREVAAGSPDETEHKESAILTKEDKTGRTESPQSRDAERDVSGEDPSHLGRKEVDDALDAHRKEDQGKLDTDVLTNQQETSPSSAQSQQESQQLQPEQAKEQSQPKPQELHQNITEVESGGASVSHSNGKGQPPTGSRDTKLEDSAEKDRRTEAFSKGGNGENDAEILQVNTIPLESNIQASQRDPQSASQDTLNLENVTVNQNPVVEKVGDSQGEGSNPQLNPQQSVSEKSKELEHSQGQKISLELAEEMVSRGQVNQSEGATNTNIDKEILPKDANPTRKESLSIKTDLQVETKQLDGEKQETSDINSESEIQPKTSPNITVTTKVLEREQDDKSGRREDETRIITVVEETEDLGSRSNHEKQHQRSQKGESIQEEGVKEEITQHKGENKKTEQQKEDPQVVDTKKIQSTLEQKTIPNAPQTEELLKTETSIIKETEEEKGEEEDDEEEEEEEEEEEDDEEEEEEEEEEESDEEPGEESDEKSGEKSDEEDDESDEYEDEESDEYEDEESDEEELYKELEELDDEELYKELEELDDEELYKEIDEESDGEEIEDKEDENDNFDMDRTGENEDDAHKYTKDKQIEEEDPSESKITERENQENEQTEELSDQTEQGNSQDSVTQQQNQKEEIKPPTND
ncbi:MSP3-like protein, partial [Plasmodium relictum]